MDLLRYLLLGDQHNRISYLEEFNTKFDQQLKESEASSKVRPARKLGAFAKKKGERAVRSQSQASKKADQSTSTNQPVNNIRHQFGVGLPEQVAKPIIDTSLIAPKLQQQVLPQNIPIVRAAPPQPMQPMSIKYNMPPNAPIQKLNFDTPYLSRHH